MKDHYQKLERMYHGAPVNQLYNNKLTIGDSTSEIEWEVNPDFFHAAESLHGSVYFKLLDDAAYFAAASIVKDVFILTSQFNIYLIRPVVSGKLYAKGNIISYTRTQILARSELRDERNRLVAEGSGSFRKGTTSLSEKPGYR